MQSVEEKSFKQRVFQVIVPLLRVYKLIAWKIYAAQNKKINLIIGGSGTNYPGWFSTDYYTLDVTNFKHFKRLFSRKKINKILAEHILEHLTVEDINAMINNVKQFASKDLIIRIAVPDGFHADQEYIDNVKPNGKGVGAFDHKNLFNYQSLSSIFEEGGFKTHLVEYWDEKGDFHKGYENDENGYIHRSFINDSRNADGQPNYTSLIIDFTLA